MMSNQTNNFTTFESAIARIYHPNVEQPNQGVVGAGFLISNQNVLTCAHVVTSALNILTGTPETPTQSIDVDFPFIAPGQKVKAKVVCWQPIQSPTATPSREGEDIAVLELESELPKQAQPVTIVPIEEENLWDHRFRVCGFPSGKVDGCWATGVLSGKLPQGWLQIEDDKVTGYRIRPGFSGAPVWDLKLASIVGITVAAEKQEEVKAAFIIPTKVLREKIPKNFLLPPDESISLPAIEPRYQPIIDAFTSGKIIPFLGAGIHSGDHVQGITIQLAIRLARDFNPQGQLLGLPCSFCPLSLDAQPPIGCPIWSRIPEGENNKALTCPLSHEQRLALAKMNLRFLSQYISFLYGENEDEDEDEEEENQNQGFYGAIHDHLDSTYDRHLTDSTNIYRLHEFLATLPKTMLKKGYRDFPCPLIITTNYDEILEQVFDEVGQDYDLVFYIAEGPEKGHFKHKTHERKERVIQYGEDYRLPLGKRPIILKLYGTWTDKFVMTEEHLINYLFGSSINQVLPSQLINFIKKRRILFLGYSLNDHDLKIILHRFWGIDPVKQQHNKSWIVHQSEPGDLEEQFWQARRVSRINSSLEDFVTALEMGIERLESQLN